MPSDLELNQFRDSKDRLWTCRVTAQHALELKQNYGIDVRFVEDPTSIQSMMAGDLKILDAIAIVLIDQLETAGITANDLFAEMDGDVFDNACWAFVYGCLFFFPSHKREPLLVWARKLRASQNQLGSLMTEKVSSTEVDQVVSEKLNRLVDQHWEN